MEGEVDAERLQTRQVGEVDTADEPVTNSVPFDPVLCQLTWLAHDCCGCSKQPADGSPNSVSMVLSPPNLVVLVRLPTAPSEPAFPESVSNSKVPDSFTGVARSVSGLFGQLDEVGLPALRMRRSSRPNWPSDLDAANRCPRPVLAS